MSRPAVLILRALGLGDLCTGVPAIRAVARAFPCHDIVLAAPSWHAAIAAQCGVTHILPITSLDDRSTGPRRRVDVGVNLHGRGPESTQLLREHGAGRLIAFGLPLPDGRDAAEWEDDEHELQRWCRLLRHWDIAADERDLALDRAALGPSESDGRPYLLIHAGAAAPARRWPADNFGDVAAAVLDAGVDVVLTGSDAEAGLCEAVASRARARSSNGRAMLSIRTGTTLRELCALVADARGVLSNDTGVAHVATAFGTPSVVLFGPTPPGRWGPPPWLPADRHTVIWKGSTGDPHGPALDPGLAAIGVDEVSLAVQRRLFGSDSRASGRDIAMSGRPVLVKATGSNEAHGPFEHPVRTSRL